MALSESNITVMLREISLKDRPNALYKISPKATVPVLQINEGEVIEQSLEIILWAIKKFKLKWLSYKPQEQLNMTSINDGDFKFLLDKYKYTDKSSVSSFEDYQNSCGEFLRKYDYILEKKPYFFGKVYQLADIALFPFIRQCAHVDQDWFENNFSNLSDWLNRINTSSLLLSVMYKYNTWDKISEGEIVRF